MAAFLLEVDLWGGPCRCIVTLLYSQLQEMLAWQ